MKFLALTLASIAMLTGCAKEAESLSTVGVGSFAVEKLFTHEGCTLYRFVDAGNRIYYTDCAGQTSWNQSHQCGKTRCYRPSGVRGQQT